MVLNKKIISLILVIFLIGIVSASLESISATGKQYEPFRIKQVCSSATSINITSISYPNSSSAVTNISMTNAGNGEFFYDFELTYLLGTYDVLGVATSCEKTFVTSFEVTPSGNENSGAGDYIQLSGFPIVAEDVASGVPLNNKIGSFFVYDSVGKDIHAEGSIMYQASSGKVYVVISSIDSTPDTDDPIFMEGTFKVED